MALPRHKLSIPFISLLIATIKIFFLRFDRGEKVALLEKELSNYWNKKRCQTLSTWRLGLYYVLRSLDLEEGDEVLITPIGMADIINSITLLKLKPIFVEMDPDTHNFDVSDLKNKITKKTKVIHITYLSGMVPNLEEIVTIAKDEDLTIVEDISQNYGATYQGKLIGTFGDAAIGTLSLGKCISSLGGGFVITNNETLYKKIKSYCDKELTKPKRGFLLKQACGQLMISIATSKYFFNFITHPIFLLLSRLSPKKMEEIHHPKYYYKNVHKQSYYENPPLLRDHWPDDILIHFSDLQAQLALSTFKRFERSLLKRRELAKALITNLNPNIKSMLPHGMLNTDDCAYFHFPIFVDKNIKEHQHYLLNNGIDTVGYALQINSDEPVFNQFQTSLPYARKIKESTLFLPIHDDFSKNDMVSMATKINAYFV